MHSKATDEFNDSLIICAINHKVEIYLINDKLNLYEKEQRLYKAKLDSLSNFNSSLKKELIQFHINHGIYLSTKLMHNEKAALEFKKALSILDSQKEDQLYNWIKYRIYYWLSQCAKKTHRYHEAITYMENAIQSYIEQENIKNISSVNDLLQEYQFLASLNKNIGKHDIFKQHLKTSIVKAERLQKKAHQNITYSIMVRNCYLTQFDYLVETNELIKAEIYLNKIEKLNRTAIDSSSFNLKLSQLEACKLNFKKSNKILEKEIERSSNKSIYASIKFRNYLVSNFIQENKYDEAQTQLLKIFKVILGEEKIDSASLKIENIKYDFNLIKTLEQQSEVLLLSLQEDQSSNIIKTIDTYLNFSFDYISHKRRNISTHADVLNSTNIFRNIINNYIRTLSILDHDIKLLKAIDFAKSFSLEFSKLKNQHLENSIHQELRIQEVNLRNKILKFEKDVISKNEAQTIINDSLIYYRNKYRELENTFIKNDNIFNELKYNIKDDLLKLTIGIKKNQSILNYYILDNEVFVFHKTEKNIELFKNKNAKALAKYISTDIENINKRKPLKFNKELSNILLPDELTLKQNVVIIPHSYLYYLPFEILNLKGTKIYANHNISYSHSEEFINNASETNEGFSFLGISPDFSNSCSKLNPLVHNQTEIRIISNLFKNEKIRNEKILKLDSFRSACKKHNIIHLATHAILGKNNSNNSYIALGSSCKDTLEHRLYLKDIIGLNMDPELVTLSSCNSAIGELIDGEGLSSLSKALFHANAKSVVSTLWQINDQSTSMIMASFYQNLKNGDAKDEALRKAKIEYLENVDPDFRHPYYWSGIIAMGDMRAIVVPSKNYKTLAFVLIILVSGFTYLKKRNTKQAA